MSTTDRLDITSETPIGSIAAVHPLATRIFSRHQMDYCCGGGQSLRQVCTAAGLDVEHVLEEIRAIVPGGETELAQWNDAPLGDLVDHIVSAYHDPLRQQLPLLEMMTHEVARVHGDEAPTTLAALESVVVSLRAELEHHMAEEERVLFPMVRRGKGARASETVSELRHEHRSTGEAIERIRELTGGYAVPADACNTWRALWAGLEDLETTMRSHVHLENNILFPRALAS